MKASRSRIKNAEAHAAKHASGPPKVSKYAAKRQGVVHMSTPGMGDGARARLVAHFAKGDA